MDDIIIINLPDNEDEALNFLLSQRNCKRVKIIGKLKEWYWDINAWIDNNKITYIDMYDLTEMTEWGDPNEYIDGPTGGICDCESIEEVVLPKNLKGLGTNYFEGCPNLHTIHIPAALEYIRHVPECPAFSGTSLKKIFLELSNKNSWIIPVFSYLDVEYSIKDANFKEINGVLYDIINNQLLKVPSKYKGDYLFPSDTFSIADFAFRDSLINTLVIPSNIKDVGTGAFRGAKIDTIIFEEGIEKISGGDDSQQNEYDPFVIGRVFSDSHIKNVILPSTLKEIGYQLFTGGDSFERVSFRYENPVFEIENDLIYNKSLKSVLAFIPNQSNEYVVRPGTKVIGKHAFSHEFINNREKIISISLPDSIEFIEEKAFYSCNFSRIELPNGLKQIGKYSFANSPLKSISIPDRVECINEGLFFLCSSLTDVKLPSDLKKIEEASFYFCSSLENIDIPISVSEIEHSCFEGCKKLKKINLPEGLKTIEAQVFNGCSSLEGIDLPETIENM